jgi:hypothetical protein
MSHSSKMELPPNHPNISRKYSCQRPSSSGSFFATYSLVSVAFPAATYRLRKIQVKTIGELMVIWGMAVELVSWTPCRLAFSPRS